MGVLDHACIAGGAHPGPPACNIMRNGECVNRIVYTKNHTLYAKYQIAKIFKKLDFL